MSTLISLLGRSIRLGTGTAEERGYSMTRYQFENGSVQKTPHIGLALQAHIHPDRMIFLGTAGSMWDVFFDEATSADDLDILQLVDAVHNSQVTDEQLSSHTSRLCSKLGMQAGSIECRVIPEARETAEQAQILSVLGQCVNAGETLDIDVTHGFRHLPMLALVSSRYLQKIRNVRVRDIYYGAFDMKDDLGNTPVLRLTGMLKMLDWIDSLSLYDGTGDYGQLASLVRDAGLSDQDAEQLAIAGFRERVNNVSEAHGALMQVRRSLSCATLTTEAQLFKPLLMDRLNWVDNNNDGTRELKLAYQYLEREDFLRAGILLTESAITKGLRSSGGDSHDHEHRRKERTHLEKQHPELRRLGNLRNAMAHGLRATDEEAARVIKNSQTLRAELKHIAKFIEKLDTRSKP